MLVLGNLTQVAGHQEEEPQNGSGTFLPSAEIEKKKVSCLAGFVAGRRTKACIPGRKQKNIWDTRDPSSSSQY